MMKSLPHPVLALALLTGGLLLGRALSSRGADISAAGEPSAQASPARPDRQVKPSRATGPAEDRHDLESLRVRYRESTTRTTLGREMERLGTAELKALALEQRALMDAQNTPEDKTARGEVAQAALKELYRREGVAALEWAAGLEEGPGRKNALAGLLEAAIQREPGAAEPWLDRYFTHYGKEGGANNQLLSAGMKAAAARGVDEILRVHGMFSETDLINPLFDAEYPADFDFAKLHSALAAETDLSEAVAQWIARDKDAAWAAVKEDVEKRGAPAAEYFGAAVYGVVMKEGEEAGAKWAAEQLAELPEDRRADCLTRLDQENKLSAAGIGALVSHLPAAERKGVAEALIRNPQNQAKAFIALESLPRGEMLGVLEAGFRPYPRGPALPAGNHSREEVARKRYEELRTRFSLTEEEMARVQAKGNP